MNVPEPCQYTYGDLTGLIRALSKRVVHSGPRKGEEARQFEAMFDLRLPVDYCQFLGNYGALLIDEVAILGFGDRGTFGLTVADATLMLRMAHSRMPADLVPIEDLGGGSFACLVCVRNNTANGSVVIVDSARPRPVTELPRVAACFCDYVYNRLVLLLPDPEVQALSRSTEQRLHGLAVLERHVQRYQQTFEYDHAKGGKLPRNHDWRPYRFCIQDVLFGATVVRHERVANCLEIDVLLTADIPEYDELAAAQALVAFLLSEAYKCGGTMELRFTKEVAGGQVPEQLQALAARYSVQLSESKHGRITSTEAKALYAALTGFSPELQEKIQTMERAGRLRMARACYAVHHGVWTREQVEMIVLGSQRPDSVLAGLAQPSQRHLYVHDLLHARAALLGGMFDRQMARRERRTEQGVPYDLEDDVRPLEISFDGLWFAKRYRCAEPVAIPWLHGYHQPIEIRAGNVVQVLVRARDAADLQAHLPVDFAQAEQLRALNGHATFVIVPSDFLELPAATRQAALARSEQFRIRLLVCPESIQSFDADAAERLARSRILRK